MTTFWIISGIYIKRQKNTNTLQSQSYFKQNKSIVPFMLQSNVVYKISCTQYKLSYVGQTSRLLPQRFKLIKDQVRIYPYFPSNFHIFQSKFIWVINHTNLSNISKFQRIWSINKEMAVVLATYIHFTPNTGGSLVLGLYFGRQLGP